jgi:hypothetical protein
LDPFFRPFVETPFYRLLKKANGPQINADKLLVFNPRSSAFVCGRPIYGLFRILLSAPPVGRQRIESKSLALPLGGFCT